MPMTLADLQAKIEGLRTMVNYNATVSLVALDELEQAVKAYAPIQEPPTAPALPFSCLARNTGSRVVIPDGGSPFNVPAGADNTVYDAYRGGDHAVWKCELRGPQGAGDTYPIRISGPNGGCWAGGAVIGTQSRDRPRSYSNFGNSRAIIFATSGKSCNNFLVEGLRVDNFWDGGAAGFQGATDNLTLRGCWWSWIRDDLFENDNRRPGWVFDDCLAESVYMGWSSRNRGTDRYSGQLQTITGCLARLFPMVGTSDPPDPGHGAMFKLDGGAPKFDLYDNTFAWEQGTSLPISSTKPGVSNDPLYDLSPARYSKLWSSSGNTICWLGAGSYPEGWWVPPGFTVLTGAEAKATWASRVARWKAAHPLVYRVPGVDT